MGFLNLVCSDFFPSFTSEIDTRRSGSSNPRLTIGLGVGLGGGAALLIVLGILSRKVLHPVYYPFTNGCAHES